MDTQQNNDQPLEMSYLCYFNHRNLYGYTVVFTNDVGKGFDMVAEKKMLKEMLNIIIDGVSLSTAGNERGVAGKAILDCLMMKYSHLVDKNTLKQIQSIIDAADEAESPAFRL
jgi:hypothetical protein